jgi:DNA polymerase
MYDSESEDIIVFDPAEQEMPKIWQERLTKANKVVAVNATFDSLIHAVVGEELYGFPMVDFDKWYCASAQFRVNAIPANLEDAAKAAKVANLKDTRGKQLIKALSIPQEDGTFNEDPALMAEMLEYCKKDVLATVDVLKATREMTENEWQHWLLCEEMNERGVRIDRELALLATQYADAEQAEIADKLTEITNGVITKPTQYQRIKKYIIEGVDKSNEHDRKLLKLMTVHKNGEKKYALDKNIRENVINAIDQQGLELMVEVEDVIRLLDAASASSVAKFRKMNDLADRVDDRVRGAFIYAGASQTHRFSSKGLQLHNMKRNCFNANDAEKVKLAMRQGASFKQGVMPTLAKLLRPALIPDDTCKFVVGDWSAIEARVLPWLADDERAERKLDLFRNGVDTYIEAAKGIYGRSDIEKDSDERQVGKVSELSLGYGGAAGAFTAMASNYGVVLPEYQVQRIVKNWRKANAWAVDFWRDLEQAAKRAIRARGSKSFSAGRITYHYAPQLLGGTLICELPDGTFIQYPFARVEHTDRGDNIVALKAAVKPAADETRKHWGEVRLWGGLLAENITQAFSAALLRDTIVRLGELQTLVVAHVHDELILEVHAGAADEVAEQLQKVMEETPEFAKGLPLKAEPVILSRYGNH